MKTPYQLLDVAPNATDEEIKQAYLQKVKINPPDRDQEKFQIIYNAYIAIKDYQSRIKQALFTLPVADFDELLEQGFQNAKALEIAPAHFSKLLRASIDSTTLSNTLSPSEKS